MRTLPSELDTRVHSDATQPGYLVQIDLPTVLRLSSREEIQWDGHTWEQGRVQVRSIDDAPGAALSATLALDNGDLSLTDLFTLNDPRDALVKIWAIDGEYSLSDGQALLLFQGELDEPSGIDDVIAFNATSEGRVRQFSPRHRLLPPLCNHMTAPGTIIDWGGERIALGIS